MAISALRETSRAVAACAWSELARRVIGLEPVRGGVAVRADAGRAATAGPLRASAAVAAVAAIRRFTPLSLRPSGFAMPGDSGPPL